MEIDWWTLAIQTVNFLVVVWLLGRFLYHPVRRVIEERQASDRAAAEEARRKAAQADKLCADYERRLADFEEYKRVREAELHTAAQSEGEEIRAAARKAAEELRDTARSEVRQMRNQALTDLRGDIAALARDLASKALSGAAADPVACLEAELGKQPVAALSRMREDLADGAPAIFISATALAEETQKHLVDTLAKYLGDRVAVTFETDAELFGGMVLRLPHGVLDGSVAARLAKAASAMIEDENDA